MRVNLPALLFLALLLCAAPLAADVAAAKQAYMRGAALETKKDYKNAITQYQAALKAEPRYLWANKQIGNCRYYMGDKDGALAAYDAYLAANPKDAKVKAFADALRVQAGGGAPGRARKAKAESAPFHRFGVQAFGGYNSYSMSDFNQVKGLTAINSGLGAGAKARFKVFPEMDAALGVEYLMASSTTEQSETYYKTKDVFSFPALSVSLGADYIYRLRIPLELHGGLALSYDQLVGANEAYSITYSYPWYSATNSYSQTFSGSGIGFQLLGGADWFITDRIALGLELGYRYSKLSPITGTDDTGTYKFKNHDGSDFSVDYSGITARLSAGFWF